MGALELSEICGLMLDSAKAGKADETLALLSHFGDDFEALRHSYLRIKETMSGAGVTA
jgi:hypothetical protein